MKTVIIFVLFSTLMSVNAQVPEEEENKAKPSWADEMPERIDAPDMDIGIETGLEGMGMDRSALFDDIDETNDQEEDSSVAEQQDSDEAQALVEQQKLEEQQRIEQELAQQKRIEEELAEQKRIEEQQRLAEQAEQRRLAEQAEQQRLEQLRIEAQKSEELQSQVPTQTEQAQEEPATEAPVEEADPVDVATTKSVQYSWKKTKNVLPKYPIKAVKNSLEGWVLIKIEISSDGKVVNAKVVNSFRNRKIFNSAALEAVKQWEFVPPSDFGLSSNQSKDVRIVFNL